MTSVRPCFVLTMLSASIACTEVSDDNTSVDLHVGRELRTISRSNLELVWIVSSEDCSSCNSPGYFWRALRAKPGVTISFRALVVGADAAPARALMQAERVAATVEHADLVPPTRIEQLPAMALVLRDTIRFVWPARGAGPFYSSLLSGAGVRGAVRVVDSIVSVAKPE
jgi:hypothetical protein